MNLYGQSSQSIPQKGIIIFLELLLLWLAYWILFQGGGGRLLGWLGVGEAPAAGVNRRIVIFAFSIIVFLRMGFTLLVLLKRRIPWEETVSVPMAFALYYVGFALFAYPSSAPLNAVDFLGIALFLVGSFLNTYSELQRHFWKQRPENRGKIYTEGLFGHAMHINYFGDVCWVTAYAILTRNGWAFVIPLFLLCFFIFFNIPKLDKYLAQKYGPSFDAYAGKTKKLIPFIY